MKPVDGPKFSKRKSYAKNKKKSWRGIDISATEEFLNDERFQLRTVGGLIADKSNDQLFVVERGGLAEHQSASEKAPKRTAKELKCYSILKNSSKIQPPRNEYPTDPNIEEKVVHRELRSLRAIKRNGISVQKNKAEKSLDLWEGKEKQEGEEFFNEVTKKRQARTPKYIKRKVSERPVVEPPHPGQSINPTYDDHQDLLRMAHSVEMMKEKKERKIYNALDAKFPCVSEAPTQATWLAEMSGCLFDEKHPDDEVVDTRHISLNPPVSRDDRKTRKRRRKEKEAKLLAKELQKKKLTGEREHRVYSIARMKSELAQRTKEEQKRLQLKEKKKEEGKTATKKLGKTKFENPDLEVKLTTELVGNLRSVKPEGNLLVDRYRSLQGRNIIEPRSKVNKKKVKTKKFEKKSFREVKI